MTRQDGMTTLKFSYLLLFPSHIKKSILTYQFLTLNFSVSSYFSNWLKFWESGREENKTNLIIAGGSKFIFSTQRNVFKLTPGGRSVGFSTAGECFWVRMLSSLWQRYLSVWQFCLNCQVFPEIVFQVFMSLGTFLSFQPRLAYYTLPAMSR